MTHEGCEKDTGQQDLLGAHGDEHSDVDQTEAMLVAHGVK